MDRVGRYEILDELYRTAFGRVCTARPIAAPPEGGAVELVIKIHELHAAAGQVAGEQAPELAGQFLERARLQQRLGQANGQHWASVHDLGREGDKPFYVTDYFPRTAQKLITGRVVLPAGSLYEIVSAVAAGLRQLHDSCGRCHGSLKPTNVLISGAGPLGGARIVLCDPLADAPPSAIGQADDFYALGTLLYQLVMHRPFRQTSWPVADSPEWRQLGKSGGDWQSLCNELLHPDQAHRPAPPALEQDLAALAPRGLTPDRFTSLATAGARRLPLRKLAASMALIALALLGGWAALYARLSASHGRVREARGRWIEALWNDKKELERLAAYGGPVIDQTDWEGVSNGSRPVPLTGISAAALRESAAARETVDRVRERLRRAYDGAGEPLRHYRERLAHDGYSTAAAGLDAMLSSPPLDEADVPRAIDRRIETAQMLASKPPPDNVAILQTLDRWVKSGDRDRAAFAPTLRAAYRRALPLTGAGWGSCPQLETLVQQIDSLPDWPASYDADRLRRDEHLDSGELTVEQVERWARNAPNYAWAPEAAEQQSAGQRLNAALEEKYKRLHAGWLGLPDAQRSGLEGLERDRAAIGRQIEALGGARFIRMEYPVALNDRTAALERQIQQFESKNQPPAAPTPPEPPAAPKIVLTNSIGMRFVEIPAGSFLMGSPPAEAYHRDDEVRHKVTLTRPFLMQTTPVTQGQWTAVMGNAVTDQMANSVVTFTIAGQGEAYPMYYVRWEEATRFCAALGRREGRNYRLPTEAEWEYACRAGTKTAYYAGDADAALAELGWYRNNSGNGTHPVAQKKPNAWGLYDMLGNVYQWCSDGYGQYPKGDVSDPTGDERSSSRVIRGGSWGSYSPSCRAAYRDKVIPANRANYIGFRVCLDSK